MEGEAINVVAVDYGTGEVGVDYLDRRICASRFNRQLGQSPLQSRMMLDEHRMLKIGVQYLTRFTIWSIPPDRRYRPLAWNAWFGVS